MKAAKSGRSVAVIERYHDVGGGCTHWGTIPSKALRHAISTARRLPLQPPLPGRLENYQVQLPDLLRAADGVIRRQVAMRHGFYERNHVHVVHGHGRFTDAHTVEVLGPNGARERLVGKATSSSPPARGPTTPRRRLQAPPRGRQRHPPASSNFTPASITIYGAGVIGCEYASMFRVLGDEGEPHQHPRQAALLPRRRDRRRPRLPPPRPGLRHPPQRGVRAVEPRTTAWCCTSRAASGSRATCSSGPTAAPATPRTWASRGSASSPTAAASSASTSNYQTALPHIYAVGDVIGPPSLASAAYDQGRFAATHIVDGACDTRLSRDIPTGIYTTPEISSLGRTSASSPRRRSPTRWATRSSAASPARRSPGRPWGCSRSSSTARRWRSSASTASATRRARSSTSARR
jgi:NAD(P) transhydrogenase